MRAITTAVPDGPLATDAQEQSSGQQQVDVVRENSSDISANITRSAGRGPHRQDVLH